MPFVSCAECGYVGPISDEDYQATIVAGETFLCTDCCPEYELEIEVGEIDLAAMLKDVIYREVPFSEVKQGDVFLDSSDGQWMPVLSISPSDWSKNGITLHLGEDHKVSAHRDHIAHIRA
jgi:hypothetical protein